LQKFFGVRRDNAPGNKKMGSGQRRGGCKRRAPCRSKRKIIIIVKRVRLCIEIAIAELPIVEFPVSERVG
jgi:hypothetical protein